MGACGRCCRRYGVDVFGTLIAVLLVALSTGNQVIMLNTHFLESSFMLGAGMCVLSLLGLVWSFINMLRTRRRYRATYEEWHTDMDEYASDQHHEAFGVPQGE